MTLYDRIQATEHIQFKSFSSVRNCGSLANGTQKQTGPENQISLKNAMLIMQTHDITLIIGIAGLIKKNPKQHNCFSYML